MAFFASARERRLWLGTLAVVLAIFSTVFLARVFADALGDSGLPEPIFGLGMLLVLATIVTHGISARPAGRELVVALAVIAAYMLMFVRMSTAAERTHLLEYGVVAILMFEALKERRRRKDFDLPPALIAIVATASLGVLDEGIQLLLPSRVFDPRDMLVNVLASVMAVGSSMAIAWARGTRAPGDRC